MRAHSQNCFQTSLFCSTPRNKWREQKKRKSILLCSLHANRATEESILERKRRDLTKKRKTAEEGGGGGGEEGESVTEKSPTRQEIIPVVNLLKGNQVHKM